MALTKNKHLEKKTVINVKKFINSSQMQLLSAQEVSDNAKDLVKLLDVCHLQFICSRNTLIVWTWLW